MTDRYRRDVRGRFTVNTSNVPESSEGSFETETGLPATIRGADAAELAYDVTPRPAQADDLAQGGSRFPLHPRHPALVVADEHARTSYGQQGALLRDAARLHGLTGMIAHVVGLESPAGPAEG